MTNIIMELYYAEQAIKTILEKNPDIMILEFSFLENNLRRREKHSSRSELISCADVDNIKGIIDVSFWQAVLGTKPLAILDNLELGNSVTFHNGPGNERRKISSQDFLSAGLSCITGKENTQHLNFLSSVILKNGTQAYIPLLDFRIKQSTNSKEIVFAVCDSISKKSGVGWHVVESSESYHAFADKYVSLQRYTSTLGWALLFDPILDSRHVAHQLIDGIGALRVQRKDRREDW